MSRFTIKLVQGDTGPTQTAQIIDKNTMVPIDLSAAATTVTFKFKKAGTTSVLQTVTCTKITPYAGVVQWDWPANALEVAAGNYVGELTLYKDGKTQTVLDMINYPLRSDF